MSVLNFISFFCFATVVSCTQWDLFFPKHGLSPLIKSRTRAGPVILSSIIQPLDHFNTENTTEWNMRYMYNREHFVPGGPIFIMLGGEWTISADLLQDGQMYDMAKQNGAFMFYTEHRFYGNSFPTKDLKTESLEHFNTDQALADVVHFIQRVKADIPDLANSKVVVFGGSYSGNMAIWLREKYPEDIFAAVSSSAPVLAKVEFNEYFEVLQTVLGEDCSGIISRAIDQILLLFGTPKGALKVQRDFNTCKPVNTNKALEVAHFIQVISTTFSSLVQYDSCGRAKSICDVLISYPNLDEYRKLVMFFEEIFPECIPTYPDIVNFISNGTVIPGQNGRQWIYQVCFQIGYMQVSTAKHQPFKNTIPLEAYHGFCADYFGAKYYNPTLSRLGVDRTNTIFGGLNPNVTRVVSVHGKADPWHKLGLNETLNPLAPVILVNGASHTFDLASINSCDSEEMVAAKLAVRSYIKDWLNSA